jgi:predicted Zn-dependent protease
MKGRKRLRSAVSLCLAVLLALTLAVEPARAIGFGEFTIADEREMGDKFAVLIRAQFPFVEDPEILGYVRALTERLVRQMPAQPWTVDVNIIQNNAINAFAGPGGHLYVFTGLLLNFQHESEVAGVMAHELAHVAQRHLAQRIETSQLLAPLTILGILAGIFLGKGGAAAAYGAQAAQASAILAYTRDNEREADQVGLNYLAAAGFPPEGMAGAFEILRRKQWMRGGSIPAYLTTHPGLDERIGYITDRIHRMPPEVADRADNDARFLRVQTLLRARYSDPDTALSYFSQATEPGGCMNALGKAIVYDRQNKVNQASEEFAKALACGNSDPLVLREAGRFAFERGRFEEAGPLLQKAVLLNPKDLIGLFFYSRLLAQTGQMERAIEYMQRISRELPEDPEVRYWLGRLQGQAGNVFQGHLQLAYAELYANHKKKIAFHLDEAKRLARTAEDKKAVEDFEAALKAREEFW